MAEIKRLTIFMYPWFAMGHITPYLLTANKLAKRGHKIFLIIPPSARPKLGPLNLYPDLIELRPISIPAVDGLPPHVETTNDVEIHEQGPLRHALDLTRPVIESLLRDLRPDFVFYDLMQWLPGLAGRLGIKAVHYCVVSPASMAFLVADNPVPSGFPPHIKLYKHVAAGLKLMETMKQSLTAAISESDVVGFKTCREIEGEYCQFLENQLKKPILLAGPIVPKPQNSVSLPEKWAIDWLDKFERKTVVFCAFGSEAVLEKDQFQQLLLGIELTGFPFFIALRPPVGAATVDEALPDGFRERNGGEKGIVYGGWVPQQLILKHAAVGCFVTHCGYGSMWEGLMSENIQLVALPHVADQYVHARLLSAVLKVAVEVEKGDEDGMFTKEAVRGAVTAAMSENVGREVRENHYKLRELLVSEGFEDAYFNGFVDKLLALLQ